MPGDTYCTVHCGAGIVIVLSALYCVGYCLPRWVPALVSCPPILCGKHHTSHGLRQFASPPEQPFSLAQWLRPELPRARFAHACVGI